MNDRIEIVWRMWGGLILVVLAIIAALVIGSMVCGWVDGFAEVQTNENAAIEWCGVCCDYVDTYIGSVGSVVVCGVCDTILVW